MSKGILTASELRSLTTLSVATLSSTPVEQWMRRLPEINADHATFDEMRRASARVSRLREELAEAEDRLVEARRDAAAYLLRKCQGRGDRSYDKVRHLTTS